MATSYIFRLAAMKGKTKVLEALKHNKRTLQAECGASGNIDATKSHLNYSLTGSYTPEQIAMHAKVQMVKAGIDKPRINQVLGVEIVFSLPVDRHSQDTKPFFIDCCDWVKKAFDGELLSFDVHLDESAPHAHAVVLPLIDGKMRGSKMMGGKGNLLRLINQFHADVAKLYGLSKSESKRLSATDKQTLSRMVLNELKTDPVMKSGIWSYVRDLVVKDPLPCAQMLSIKLATATQAKGKSFVAIMTSKGRGSNINPI
jgi:hypothetical protein